MNNISKKDRKNKENKSSFWKSFEKKFKKYFELNNTLFSSHFFINGLPLKCQDKRNIFSWQGRMGQTKIKIHATAEFGLPYGVYARLIQIWIDTSLVKGDYEALDEGYRLNIGRSFNDFLINKIKVGNSGRFYNKIYDQIFRFSHCIFEIKDNLGKGISFPLSIHNTFLCSTSTKFKYPKTMIINKAYGDLIVKEKRAFPIPENVFFLFRETPLGMDFLRFLIRQTYIATKQNKIIKIPMISVAEQLAQNKMKKVTTKRIKEYLKALKVVWNGLNVDITDGKNRFKPSIIIIKPSDFLISPNYKD